MHLPSQSRQVTLKDILGAEVPDVWVHVSRPIDLDERSPAVLIVGSAVELSNRSMPVISGSDLQEHCRAVGRLLAERGLHLVADACPGIPYLIEQAYLASRPRGVLVDLSILRGPHEPDTNRAYSPTGFPAGGDLLVFCGTGFEVLSIVNTYCADLVLLVGGGLGSLMEGIIAVISDLPVVCYSPAGGVAVEMQSLFERYRSRYKNLQIDTVSTLEALDEFLDEFSSRFRHAGSVSRLGRFCSSLGQELHSALEGAQIHVDGELQSISYRFGPCQIEVTSPQLAIDDARLLQDPSAGSALRTYLDTQPRQYSFDGVSIEVPAGVPQKVWCPSIDTFTLLATLRSDLDCRYDTALDIGSGTGLIALWLAATNRAAETYGIDKNAEATRCAAVNGAALGLAPRCHFRTAKFTSFRRDAPPFQLIACNPPYVPRPPEQTDLEDGSFEGVNLVQEVLSSLDSVLAPGGVCYLGLSSTSWTHPMVRERMENLIAQRRAVKLYEAAVPFKVANVLLNQPWLEQLVSGGGVFHDPAARYAFWHRIQIWKLTR